MEDTSSISINGVPVETPKEVDKATKKYELTTPELYISGYRVKHFGFYIHEDGNNSWSSVSYYRKGMKIGDIDIKDIPERLKGKYWGYIEVDEDWESDLATIEDKVHFGVSKGKKHTTTYQNLKNYCDSKIKTLLVDWGYIKDKENEDKKLRDELQEIAEDIQDLFDELGFEDLGKGPQKPDFDVRWQDIQYPNNDTERVETGESIHYSFRIKSMYSTNKKFEFKLFVMNPETREVVCTLAEDKISIAANDVYKRDDILTICEDNSVRYSENRIVLTVKVVGSGNEKRKELQYFYDIDRPVNTKDAVLLNLHECYFPVEGSRRVNFNESIKNVCYRIENKRNHKLAYKLNVSIHNANDVNCPKIVDIASFNGVIDPFEDDITPYIGEIMFSQSVYSKFLESGVLELRARLIAAEDDEQYEKGDKITFYHYKIFLNCDEKHGKNDAFEIKSMDAKDNYRRSWCDAGARRTIYINIGHSAYTFLSEFPEVQHEYLREQMLKQYVMLYLLEGKYDMFKIDNKDFSDLEAHEAAEQVVNKIESVYFRSLS